LDANAGFEGNPALPGTPGFAASTGFASGFPPPGAGFPALGTAFRPIEPPALEPFPEGDPFPDDAEAPGPVGSGSEGVEEVGT
jgi:hypothetical protein